MAVLVGSVAQVRLPAAATPRSASVGRLWASQWGPKNLSVSDERMRASLVIHRDASVRAVRVAICRHLSRDTSQAMPTYAHQRLMSVLCVWPSVARTGPCVCKRVRKRVRKR